MSFDLSLPGLYKEKWREAYRADNEDSPRLSSYQAPDGEPLSFIYKSLEFSGGQAVDTAEYPFNGLWSNESLNQKPQTITVRGFLRGEEYLKQRAAFVDALLKPTSDDSPGFFDHPLWGRFKVVVENYLIEESATENGQCEISLTLKRAGVSLEARAVEASSASSMVFLKGAVELSSSSSFKASIKNPKESALVAAHKFSQKAAELNTNTLVQSFGQLKSQLLKSIGRIREAQTLLNTVTNEINGISNLIAQGIKEPMLLAQTLVNAVFSITGAAVSISESAVTAFKYFFKPDNKKTTAMMFLSSASYKLPVDAVTVMQMETKTLIENLYRTICLCAAADLLTQMNDITFNEMSGYWVLYTNLENSVNQEDPDLYKVLVEMRSMLSYTLKQTVMRNELKRNVLKPVPLLLLSHHLGCNDEKLRQMNLIEDSLLISGEISYV